jgi:hypothetical protein
MGNKHQQPSSATSRSSTRGSFKNVKYIDENEIKQDEQHKHSHNLLAKLLMHGHRKHQEEQLLQKDEHENHESMLDVMRRLDGETMTMPPKEKTRSNPNLMGKGEAC